MVEPPLLFGGGFALAPWDWWYYADKVKKARYDLDEEMLRPYFELDRVRAAIQGDRSSLVDSGIASQADAVSLADLIAYETRIENVREWPFDAPTMLRFALYLAIPLGSWLGGAFVERLLGAALD